MLRSCRGHADCCPARREKARAADRVSVSLRMFVGWRRRWGRRRQRRAVRVARRAAPAAGGATGGGRGQRRPDRRQRRWRRRRWKCGRRWSDRRQRRQRRRRRQPVDAAAAAAAPVAAVARPAAAAAGPRDAAAAAGQTAGSGGQTGGNGGRAAAPVEAARRQRRKSRRGWTGGAQSCSELRDRLRQGAHAGADVQRGPEPTAVHAAGELPLACGCPTYVNDKTELDKIHAQCGRSRLHPEHRLPGDRLPAARRGGCVPIDSGDFC